MPAEITMPQLSDTMTEGTVVKWLKKEGDKVKANEVLAEVETDKANMEMEAFEGGTLAHIAIREGEKVAVGGTIAYLATGSDDPASVKKQFAGGAKAALNPPTAALATAASPAAVITAAQQAAASAASPPGLRGGGGGAATIEKASTGEIHETATVGHGATRSTPTPVPPLPASNGNGSYGNGHRLIVSPLARRIAADKGVDLSTLQGTGPSGRIVQADVLAAADKPKPTAVAETPKAGGATTQPTRVRTGERQVIPLTKMRQTIATRLQQSKQQVPHIYEVIDIEMDAANALRERLNKQLEAEKIRLSVADFIAKAVAVALVKHPAMNAHFDGAKNEIIRFGDVNLGTAVALPDGLIVPVLRNAQQMGLRELRTRSADLIDRARGQRLKREEMTGGTFTISSLATFGVREFSAIVNPPEVAILAVAGAEPRAVVRNGQIVARTMMTVTLSADHRAIDGAVAGDFLRTLKNLLEEPGMMLV